MNPAGEKLRQVLKELDASKDAGQSAELGSQARELIRVHIAESQDVVRDLQERLRMSQEESDLQAKKKVEMEKMLARRDAAYEELLGESGLRIKSLSLTSVEKSTSSQTVAVADIKVS